MDANFCLLSPWMHMCECTACVYCSALCRGNPTHPALPARLPTHHCSTHVQVQTPQGKNYSSLRSAPPSHFCRLHQAIYSFRINWKVNEGMCVWRISFPLVPFAVSNQFLLQGNPTLRLQPRFQGWHHVSSYPWNLTPFWKYLSRQKWFLVIMKY